MRGYRLHAYSRINSEDLFVKLSQGQDENLSRERSIIQESTSRNKALALAEALSVIAHCHQPISRYAKTCGLSLRSFQRLLGTHTGKSANYWRQLARIRNAGRRVFNHDRLCDIALEAGFSDQAHMTREFKRWFKCSPAQFSLNPELQSQLYQPAFA